MGTVSRNIDRYDVFFDDPKLVSNAGLILAATLIKRLGLESLINQWVHLRGRVGGALPGRKVLTMVCAIITGIGRPTSTTSTSCVPAPHRRCCRSG